MMWFLWLFATISVSGLKLRASQLKKSPDAITQLNSLLDRFTTFAVQTNESTRVLEATEEAKLNQALGTTTDGVAQLAISQSITNSQESRVHSSHVVKEMLKFIGTMKQIVGHVPSDGSGNTCSSVICGSHASCTRTVDGPICLCDEGYEGDGKVCSPPAVFVPDRVLNDGNMGRSREVGDVNIVSFSDTLLALVFRDITHSNVGRIVLGEFSDGHVEFSAPTAFSSGQAFDPIVVGLGGNKVAIAFRDAEVEGRGWLRTGELGATSVRGADKHITWGEPLEIAKGQAHRFACVPLGTEHMVVIHAGTRPATLVTPEQHFAAAGLFYVGTRGYAKELGSYHFLEFAVTRLSAVLLSDNSFVVAYRAAKKVDDVDTSVVTRQEASCIYASYEEGELVFAPTSLDLEPNAINVWGRGLARITPTKFAYAYHMGTKQATKLAIVVIDPTEHTMKVESSRELHEGVTPYVQMVSAPYSPSDPHTFVYYDVDGTSVASICRLTDAGIDRCEETVWMKMPVTSVSSVAIGGGRTLFAFADKAGVLYTQLIGLSKK